MTRQAKDMEVENHLQSWGEDCREDCRDKWEDICIPAPLWTAFGNDWSVYETLLKVYGTDGADDSLHLSAPLWAWKDNPAYRVEEFALAIHFQAANVVRETVLPKKQTVNRSRLFQQWKTSPLMSFLKF